MADDTNLKFRMLNEGKG